MPKPIHLQYLATKMYMTLRGFSEARYTGQVHFHITMHQGGASRAELLTEAAFAYEGVRDDPVGSAFMDDLPPPDPPPPPPPSASQPRTGGYKTPHINLIATMSKKE